MKIAYGGGKQCRVLGMAVSHVHVAAQVQWHGFINVLCTGVMTLFTSTRFPVRPNVSVRLCAHGTQKILCRTVQRAAAINGLA